MGLAGLRPPDYSSNRIPATQLPHSRNPAQGYLVNWNNKQAPGWRAADDYWNYGSVQRMTRLRTGSGGGSGANAS